MHLISQNVDFMNDLIKLIMDNTKITISFVENPVIEYEYADYSGKALIASYSMPLSTGEGISQGVLAGATLISQLFTGKSLGVSIDGIGSDIVDEIFSGLEKDALGILGDMADGDDSEGIQERIEQSIKSGKYNEEGDANLYNAGRPGKESGKIEENTGTTSEQTAFNLNSTTIKAEHLINYNNEINVKKIVTKMLQEELVEHLKEL